MRLTIGTFGGSQECGCFDKNRYNTDRILDVDITFPVEETFELCGAITIPSFRSRRFSNVIVANWTGVQAASQGQEESVRNAADSVIRTVNANGGWTIIGWLRTGIAQDSSSRDAGGENIAAITQSPHITYLYPTNREWTRAAGHRYQEARLDLSREQTATQTTQADAASVTTETDNGRQSAGKGTRSVARGTSNIHGNGNRQGRLGKMPRTRRRQRHRVTTEASAIESIEGAQDGAVLSNSEEEDDASRTGAAPPSPEGNDRRGTVVETSTTANTVVDPVANHAVLNGFEIEPQLELARCSHEDDSVACDLAGLANAEYETAETTATTDDTAAVNGVDGTGSMVNGNTFPQDETQPREPHSNSDDEDDEDDEEELSWQPGPTMSKRPRYRLRGTPE